MVHKARFHAASPAENVGLMFGCLGTLPHSGDRGPVELKCSSSRCGHVSGELLPGYVYREEHRPSWEREGGEGPGANGR